MTTDTAPTIEIVLPPLHPSQRLIAKDPHRFKVVCCGRKWGKTLLAAAVLLKDAPSGGLFQHIAPTYRQTQEAWNLIEKAVNQWPRSVVKQVIHSAGSEQVLFTTDGVIEMRTGDVPANLRGPKLRGAVLDECAFQKPETWEKVIRPALAIDQGWALFPSTPQHFNWFYDLYELGQDPEQKEWASWQFPAWDNPFLSEDELESLQRNMAPADFNQEIGASFTAVGGAIWPALSANRMVYLRPKPKDVVFYRVAVGIDWGTTKEHQWNVTCDGLMKSGVVWRLSSKLSADGSDAALMDEVDRCKKDYGATEAYYDRSQGGFKDRLRVKGLRAEPGLASVDGRIGVYGGHIQKRTLYFDSDGPGVKDNFTHCTMYHRDKDGKVVEENDDDVDGGGYSLSGLTLQREELPDRVRNRSPQRTEVKFWNV